MSLKDALISCEEMLVRTGMRVADRVITPRTRRRHISAYILLVAEASEAGADHDSALAIADRLMRPGADDCALRVRRLQATARAHGRDSAKHRTVEGKIGKETLSNGLTQG